MAMMFNSMLSIRKYVFFDVFNLRVELFIK